MEAAKVRGEQWIFQGVKVLKVIDGDTFDGELRFELGFGCEATIRQRFRLYGIQAPELSKAKTPEEREAGTKARAFLAAMIEGKEVEVRSRKVKGRVDQEKYGRFLATVFAAGLIGSVNEAMLAGGHADKVRY
jgi:endonuclease YncB( thermonuclease family)